MSPTLKRLILVVFLGLELALVVVATTDMFSSVAVSDTQLYISMGALALAYVGYLKLGATMAQRGQVREKERTGRILETIPLPALLLDAQGRITVANQRAQRVLGLGLQHLGSEAASLFEAPSPHPLKGGFSGSAKARCLPSARDVELTVEFRGDATGADSIVLVRPVDAPPPATTAPAATSDPARVAEKALGDFKPWMDLRKVSLKTELTPGLSMPLSPEILEQVLKRLIVRALASSPDGSSLDVRLSGDSGVELSLADRGAGFDPAQATSGPGGPTLAIVQSMVEAAGGTLTLEGAPGKGCRVTLRF